LNFYYLLKYQGPSLNPLLLYSNFQILTRSRQNLEIEKKG